MKSRFINIALSILLFAGLYSAVYSQNLQFRHYSSDEGFTGAAFKRIAQDSLGFMWIATTSGLYRFDGYTFHHYTQVPGDSLNFPVDVGLSPMGADPAGAIWLAVKDRLSTYVHREERFYSYPLPQTDYKTQCLGFSGTTKVWIGTQGKGLLCFDREKKSVSVNMNSHSPSGNTIFDIVDEGETLLIGTSGGLWKFRLKDNKFFRPMSGISESSPLYTGEVKKIFAHSGYYWLWIDQKLMKVRTNGAIVNVLDFEKLHQQFDVEKKFPSAEIISIAEDKDGKFWMASQGLGLIYFDPATNEYLNFRKSGKTEADNNSLPSDVLYHVMIDRDKNIWFSTVNKGIVQLKKRSLIFYNYLNGISSTGIGMIAGEQSPPILAVGTNGSGLWTTHFQTDDLHNLKFERFNMNPSARGFENIIEMYVGKKNLWLGTLNAGVIGLPIDQNGLLKDKPRYRYFNDKDNPQSLSADFITSFWEDPYGYLWIGTYTGGFNIIKPEATGNLFVNHRNIADDPKSLLSSGVRNIRPQKDGSLLVATFEGLDRIVNPIAPYKELKIEHLIDRYYCNQVYVTLDGTLLLSTKTGLLEGVKVGDSYKFEKVPLPGTPNVTFLEEDLLGRIWCMSFEGLFFYDREKKFVLVFKKDDGLPSSRSVMAGRSWQTPEGIMIFSNGEGVTIFNPLTLKINDSEPKPVITQLRINNELVSTGSNSDFSIPESIVTLPQLELNYTHNILELEFSAMDMTAPEKNQYKYMLEGFSDTWVNTDWNNRKATYTNLDPGNYTFKVMASNRDGVWSDQVTSIKITVLPPPWNTWWAYTIYAAIIMSMLFVARRSILKEERLKASLKIDEIELEKKEIALQKAQEVDRLKSAFFTNISHEFRTPLTLIQGPVQMLLEKFSADPKVKRQLMLIQNNTHLLLKLINQLLELARLESGNLTVENEQTDLNLFLKSIIDHFESEARQKDMVLELKVPAEFYDLSLDKGKVETILINLLGNSMKFTPANGRVTLKANLIKPVHANNGTSPLLSIVVADSGIGIPAENQSLIFERFYQVNETHKEIGTGIGLALVKELTQLLKGTVTVKSAPGAGSEFTLKIPVQIIGVHDTEQPKSMDQLIQPTLKAGINGLDDQFNMASKILVVEDNQDLRKFIIDSFDSLYHFIEAANGVEGFEKAIHEIPELIISDIMMPEMDGITMSSKIKKDIRTSHIPILFLTAKATEKSKLSGLQTGAEDYLTKPFNKDELILKVKNIISSREKIREKLRLDFLNESPTIVAESADEQFLVKVKEIIHQRLNDPKLGVDTLALDIGLSRTQLYRKITGLTGSSVNELIRNFRLQKAAQLLHQGWGSVSDVAYEVGFSNLSYFSKCFKEQFGVLPSEYQTK